MSRSGKLASVRSLLGFVFSGRRLWLLPIVVLLLLVTLLAVANALTPFASFLYPL